MASTRCSEETTLNGSDSRQEKYRRLKAVLSSYGKVMVALSGGLDSSFLLFAATETLGVKNTRAVIGVSDSLPQSEFDVARDFALSLGIPEEQIIPLKTRELDNPDYASNPPNRCFFCKTELFREMGKLTAEGAGEVVCDGANASDVGDYRPGMTAARENGVKSPLLEAGLAKDEIRQLAKDLGLSVWDKPQSACLASRIPYGSEITVAKLKQIDAAEVFLRSLGFRQLRVRHHDAIARIELPLEEMQRVFSNGLSEKIAARFREIGFLFTTLDISGFRSGSMNIMLKGDKNG